jgi:hypothetical protein
MKCPQYPWLFQLTYFAATLFFCICWNGMPDWFWTCIFYSGSGFSCRTIPFEAIACSWHFTPYTVPIPKTKQSSECPWDTNLCKATSTEWTNQRNGVWQLWDGQCGPRIQITERQGRLPTHPASAHLLYGCILTSTENKSSELFSVPGTGRPYTAIRRRARATPPSYQLSPQGF